MPEQTEQDGGLQVDKAYVRVVVEAAAVASQNSESAAPPLQRALSKLDLALDALDRARDSKVASPPHKDKAND